MNKRVIAVIVVVALIAGAAAGLYMSGAFNKDSGEVYSVEYNTNGGYIINDGTTFTKDTETFLLTVPMKANCSFLGWYTSPDFSGEAISQIVRGTNHNISLWAKWQFQKTSIPTAEEMASNTDINVTFKSDTSITEKKVTKEVIDKITPGKTLSITSLDSNNNVEMVWTFDGSKPVEGALSSTILPTATVLDVKVEPNKAAAETAKEVVLKFSHSGKLPYESTVKYYLGTTFADKLVNISNSSDVKSIGQFMVDSEGYVEFTIDHCSDWIISMWVTITFNIKTGADPTLAGSFSDGTHTFVTGKKYAEPNSAVELPVAYWAGYMFDKWLEEGTNYPFDASSLSKYTSDLSFKDSWIPVTYNVSFACEGYDYPSIEYNIETPDFTIASKIPGNPERTGYAFLGWSTVMDSAGSIIDTIKKGTYGNITLYPIWKPVAVKAVYSSGGAAMDSEHVDVTFGQKYPELEIPERTGYTFAGWFLDTDFTKEITSDTVVTAVTDHYLYAKWTFIVYNITYNTGFDDLSVGVNLTYNVESQFVLSSLFKTGYLFRGWFDNESFSGDAVSTIMKGTNGDKVFYAKWTPRNYDVSYKANGGTVDASKISVTFGQTYPELEIPVRVGYDFLGWYLDSALSNEITEETVVQKASDHTIYAKWAAIEYSIYYNTGCESVVIDTNTTYTIESEFEFEIPEREGYVFLGWFIEVECTGEPIKGIVKGNYGDIDLYAGWAVAECDVTFETNGGTMETESITVEYGSKYPSLETPVRAGYDFLGWFADPDFTDEVTEDTVVTVYNDHVLYAKWSAIEYSVTYYTGFNDLVVSTNLTYTVEDTFDLPEIGKLDNIFLGWYTDTDFTEQIQNVTGMSGDLEVYAKWAPTLVLDVTLDGTVHSGAVVMLYCIKGGYPLAEQSDGSYIIDITDLIGGQYIILVDDITIRDDYDIKESEVLTAELFTVSFDVTGISVDPIVVPKGSKIDKPASLSNVILCDSDTEEEFDFDTDTVEKTLTLTAISMGSPSGKVNIHFDTQCGLNGPAASDYTYIVLEATKGQLMPAFGDGQKYASREGYTFDGFEYGGKLYYDSNYNPLEICDFNVDTTLSAKWIPETRTVIMIKEPSVTFRGLMGNGWTDKGTQLEKSFGYGTPIGAVYLDLNMSPTKVGHYLTTFEVAHASKKNVDYVDGNITITPMFIVKSYIIKYDLTGHDDYDEMMNTPVVFGTTFTLPGALQKDHSTFLGWKIGETTYDPNTALKLNADLVQYENIGFIIEFEAVWQAETVTIHFAPGEGIVNEAVADVVAEYGQIVDLPVPTYTAELEGAVAYWWKIDTGDSTIEYLNKALIDDDFLALASDGEITMYANWVVRSYLYMEVGDQFRGEIRTLNSDGSYSTLDRYYTVIAIHDYTYTVEQSVIRFAVYQPECIFECINGTYPICMPQELIHLYPKMVETEETSNYLVDLSGSLTPFNNVPTYSCSGSDGSIIGINVVKNTKQMLGYSNTKTDSSGKIYSLNRVQDFSGAHAVTFNDGNDSNVPRSDLSTYPTADDLGFYRLGYCLDYWMITLSDGSTLRYYPGDLIVGNRTIMGYTCYAVWKATDIAWSIDTCDSFTGTIDVTVNGENASSKFSDAGTFRVGSMYTIQWSKGFNQDYYSFKSGTETYYVTVWASSGVDVKIAKDQTCLEITFSGMAKYGVYITVTDTPPKTTNNITINMMTQASNSASHDDARTSNNVMDEGARKFFEVNGLLP